MITKDEMINKRLEKIVQELISKGYKVTNEGQVIGKNNKVITNIIVMINKKITKKIANKVEKYIELGGIVNGKSLESIVVALKDIDNAKWVSENWGLKAIIYPRMEKEFVLMIKEIADDIENEIVIDNVGWYSENGKYNYVFSNETIGKANVRADLDEHLKNYKTLEDSKDLKSDCKKSLNLLDIVNRKTSYTLFGLVYLAPALEFIGLKSKLPEFVVWLYGGTGSGKTTLARQFLAHFGDFKNSLPSSFNDTYSSIELKSYRLKDVLMVLDDFCPQGSYRETQNMNNTAEKIVRAFCDRVSRGRLNINLESQQQFIPRGNLLITGETLITGHSTVARVIPLEINRNDINWKKMSESQKHTKSLARCMKGYIKYLCEQANDNVKDLSKIIVSIYEDYVSFFRENAEQSHGRTYEAFAWVATGIDIGMQFFRDIGLISEEEISEYTEEAAQEFLELIKMKSNNIAENKPSQIFLETLKDIIACSVVGILNLETREIIGNANNVKGYNDSKYYYFNYSEIFSIINQRLRNENIYLPFTSKGLLRELVNDDVVIKDPSGGNIKKEIIDENNIKQRRRVLCVRKEFLEG